MPIKLALRLSGRHKLFQVLMLLLLVSAFFLVLVCTSIVTYRMRFYMPLHSDLNQKGESYGAVSMSCERDGEMYFAKCRTDMENWLEDVKKVYGSYCWSPVYCDDRQVSCWSYDTELIEKCTPEMEEGRWLCKSDGDTQMLQAVVYNRDGKVHAGDVLTLDEENFGYSIEVQVVGVLKEESLIFGFDTMAEDNNGTCEDYYVSPEILAYRGAYAMQEPESVSLGSKPPSPTVLFFHNDALDKNPYFSEKAGGDGTGIQRVLSGMVIFVWQDDISETTIGKNLEKLTQVECEYVQKLPLSERKENSQRYIASQLFVIAPIGIIVILLLLVAMLSFEILQTTQQMKNYAVFFICGMNWKKCALINLWHEVVLHTAAVILFAVIYFVIVVVLRYQYDLLAFHLSGVLIILGISLFNIFLSVLLPRIIIGKTKPKTLFYEHG